MPQYRTITITPGFGSPLSAQIDQKATDLGRSGWRVLDVVHEAPNRARVQFVKD